MTGPRAIRIARPGARLVRQARAPPEGAATPERAPEAPEPFERRKNRAAFERSFRLATIYLVALLALYVGFVLLDRSSPGGTSPAAQTGLLYFTGFATVLALGGVLFALSSSPRAVEIHREAVVVVAWWGGRRKFPRLDELRVMVVRRFPASFLSGRPVEVVEISDPKGGRRTYHLEEGLVPEQRPAGPTPGG